MRSLASQLLLLAASLLSSSTTATPLKTSQNTVSSNKGAQATSPKARFTAFGLGVSSRAAASKWYSDTLGVTHAASLPVSLAPGAAYLGLGPDENIGLLGLTGLAMALMDFPPESGRSVKDLPVMLQFTVPDAKAAQMKVINGGGSAWSKNMTTPMSGALYAKDPDGYLLEFISTPESTSGKWSALTSVGIGVADLKKTSSFFASTMGTEASPVRTSEAFDIVTMKGAENCDLAFMEWHESPRRSTSDLPLKLVMVSLSPVDYLNSMLNAGAKKIFSAWLVSFSKTPDDQITIEIN